MNIGLIAHDSKKMLMQNFCIAYRGILGKHELFATGTTGRMVEEVTNLSVYKYLPGNLGGMQQMGSQIEGNTLDALILLREPNRPGPRDMDADSIIKLCDAYNIPVATNLATAELTIHGIDRGDLDWREMYK
jgi:methylglyoxal synthase